MRRSLLVLALGFLSPSAGAQSPSRTELVGRLDSLARDFITAAPAAGATVAVINEPI